MTDSDQGFTKIKPRNGKEASPVLDKEASSGAVESSTRSFVILGLIFLSSIGALGLVYLSFPEVAPYVDNITFLYYILLVFYYDKGCRIFSL